MNIRSSLLGLGPIGYELGEGGQKQRYKVCDREGSYGKDTESERGEELREQCMNNAGQRWYY
jgi:hypothetical protein